MIATSKQIRVTVDEYFRMSDAGVFESIEVYRKPENPTGKPKDWRYAGVRQFKTGEDVGILEFPKIKPAVDETIP